MLNKKMIIKIFTFLGFFFLVCTASSEKTPESSYERYKILSERNIYLKNRMPQSKPVQETGQPILREIPVPVQKKLLTGIVNYGSEYIAFFEDTASRKTIRLREGDTLLNKLIESISLDYIEYTENGKKNRVRIGESIYNAVDNKPQAVEIVLPSINTIDTKPDENTLLERLRLRRQMELQ